MLKEREFAKSVEKTEEYQPLFIDKDGKRIKINDKIISFPEGGYRWEVLLVLASNPHKDISYSTIRGVEEQSGSKANATSSLRSIPGLRQMMEEDPKEPKIIIRSKTYSPGGETAYRLEADVKFIEDSDPDKEKIFPAQELLLDERQIQAAYAFFTLNGEGTDFKYVSKAEIRREVFKDKFLDIPDIEEGREINRPGMISWGCGPEFDRIRNRITKILRESNQIPLGKMHPETAAFISWLRTQPVYENLSIENLTLVVKREMSFKQLNRLKAQKNTLST